MAPDQFAFGGEGDFGSGAFEFGGGGDSGAGRATTKSAGRATTKAKVTKAARGGGDGGQGEPCRGDKRKRRAAAAADDDDDDDNAQSVAEWRTRPGAW